MRVKVVKNKVAAPFRQAEFDIEYGLGISSEGCLIDLGLEHDIVQKSGSFFSYGDERLGQGRNNAKAYLRENPDKAAEIERKIYDALGVEPAAAPLAAVEAPPETAEEEAAGGGEGRLEPPRPQADGRDSDSTAGGPAGGRAGAAGRVGTRPHGRRAAHLPRAQAGGAGRDRRRGGRARRPPGCSTTPRYARRFAEDKRELQRWGSERIERELRKRGVAPELIEAALARHRALGRARRRPSASLRERFGAPARRPRARPRLAAARAPRLRAGAGLRGRARARARHAGLTAVLACAGPTPGVPWSVSGRPGRLRLK